jgi:hypothetical protein
MTSAPSRGTGHKAGKAHRALAAFDRRAAGDTSLNPFDYLKDLFTRLPAAKIKEVGQFTLRAWASAKAKRKSRVGKSRFGTAFLNSTIP